MEKLLKQGVVFTLVCIITILTACKKDSNVEPEPQKNLLEGMWSTVKYEELSGATWTSYPLEDYEKDDTIIFTATTATFNYGANRQSWETNTTVSYTYDASTKKLTFQSGASYVISLSATELVISEFDVRTTYKKK